MLVAATDHRAVRTDPMSPAEGRGQRAAVMLVLVPVPYVWLAILGPHSKLHHAYTYRVQAIAVFAVVYFFAASVDWGRVRWRSAERGLVA